MGARAETAHGNEVRIPVEESDIGACPFECTSLIKKTKVVACLTLALLGLGELSSGEKAKQIESVRWAHNYSLRAA